jgi:hypothetical protein
MKQILQRLKEPSTWSSLGGLALAAGISFDDWAQYSAFGVALASFALGIVFREKGGAK